MLWCYMDNRLKNTVMPENIAIWWPWGWEPHSMDGIRVIINIVKHSHQLWTTSIKISYRGRPHICLSHMVSFLLSTAKHILNNTLNTAPSLLPNFRREVLLFKVMPLLRSSYFSYLWNPAVHSLIEKNIHMNMNTHHIICRPAVKYPFT